MNVYIALVIYVQVH